MTVDGFSVIRHQSSVIRHPSSVIRHPSSVISHPSSVIRHPSSVIRHPSSVISHPSSVIRHQSPVSRLHLALRWKTMLDSAFIAIKFHGGFEEFKTPISCILDATIAQRLHFFCLHRLKTTGDVYDGLRLR
ncbi:Tryptophan 2,3-dioxygenase [Nostoc sphaeroides CCNUC1]|uniref:Tryptophan 2,3-dioxygenase n=1 Tax=Nostoc sphaeroides CCNUC1 TaxID=2653204 RepID=A0A5P8WAU6_9NOSO|nr:Tryptophan 2,3-dioxygenase [Nostoc sphaeroides CCNUC1]